MNLRTLLPVLIVFTAVTISCKDKDSKVSVNANTNTIATADDSPTDPANLKRISLNIEGMTCEIGCAKTIQSKLSKTRGIENARVDFDDKQGDITYDSSKISVESIVEIVEEIAGGDLYSVSKVHEND